jgi:hypothetical protein
MAMHDGIAKNKILLRGMCDFTGKNDIFVILLRNGTILWAKDAKLWLI